MYHNIIDIQVLERIYLIFGLVLWCLMPLLTIFQLSWWSAVNLIEVCVTQSLFPMIGLGLWCLMPLLTIFGYVVVVSFIGGGNRSILRKPPTCRKSLTNFIT